MNYKQTGELNERAIKILESNQILPLYSQLKKGTKLFLNKAIRINQKGKPFTVSDFPEVKKSVRKKIIFELRRAGIIETLMVSGYAYYRVKGFRLDNFWEKVTPNPIEGMIKDSTIQEEMYQVLEEYFKDLDSLALHNIRLHLYDDCIYSIIKREYEEEHPWNIQYNDSNRSFTIQPPIFGFEEFGITIILTPTKLIQVLIKNTLKPVIYDETGLLELVNLLGEIRYYLCRRSRDIPQVLDWMFIRADFGRDCKKPLNKIIPNLQFRHVSGALMRVYAKEWNLGERRLRVEKIVSPNKTMKNIITNVLEESIVN